MTDEFLDWLTAEKHLSGNHDQRKHGYRLGKTPSLSRARQLKKDGNWDDYVDRARARRGKPAREKNPEAPPKQTEKPQNGGPKRKVTEDDVNYLMKRGNSEEFYHITMPDRLVSIAENGLIPQDAPSGQSWSADHSNYATYFHGSEGGARSNIDNIAIDVERKPPLVIAEYSYNDRNAARDFASRVLPDEDVSKDINYSVKNLIRDGESVAIIGGAKPKQLTILVDKKGYWDDVDFDELFSAASKSGAMVMTFDQYNDLMGDDIF